MLCDSCGTQLRICRHCDRGQRYCAGKCAREARLASVKAAGRRYGQSPRGRETNRERQRRHRLRTRTVAVPEIDAVTHQGCSSPPEVASEHPTVEIVPGREEEGPRHKPGPVEIESDGDNARRCSFCHARGGAFLRQCPVWNRRRARLERSRSDLAPRPRQPESRGSS